MTNPSFLPYKKESKHSIRKSLLEIIKILKEQHVVLFSIILYFTKEKDINKIKDLINSEREYKKLANSFVTYKMLIDKGIGKAKTIAACGQEKIYIYELSRTPSRSIITASILWQQETQDIKNKISMVQQMHFNSKIGNKIFQLFNVHEFSCPDKELTFRCEWNHLNPHQKRKIINKETFIEQKLSLSCARKHGEATRIPKCTTKLTFYVEYVKPKEQYDEIIKDRLDPIIKQIIEQGQNLSTSFALEILINRLSNKKFI